MKCISAALFAASLLCSNSLAAQEPAAWEGVVEVKSRNADHVYLRPGADFRGYTKVQLDPTQVAFRRNWQRDQGLDRVGLEGRVSDSEARRILNDAQSGFEKLFAKAYSDAGYEVVTVAGPDVLRLSTAIINLDVTAPDTASAGLTRTYSRNAGEATLVLEARDSISGELLARAVDRRETSDLGPYIRNRASNAAEFGRVFEKWAKTSAEGLAEIKSLSPVSGAPAPTRR